MVSATMLRAEGDSIIHVESGEVVTERLSMPHNPRLHDGRLWVLNSGTGHLGTVDLAAPGRFEPHTLLPRAFSAASTSTAGQPIVTLSLPRHSFAGLLDEALKRRDAPSRGAASRSSISNRAMWSIGSGSMARSASCST